MLRCQPWGADRDNANGGAGMRRLESDVVAAGCRRSVAQRARRRWVLVVLVGTIMCMSLGSAPGAIAISLSRAWLAHSPLRAAMPGRASRMLLARASRSLPFEVNRGRRSTIERDTAHPATAGGGRSWAGSPLPLRA